ncbi:hypothetical protein ZTR_06019 [Talaromyces verruculosus]|nr:hypothetical protein ZTR_06019 [Talaromyces verruculosus]
MYQEIKNGESVTLQDILELFEGYLVNLNQSYKTNNIEPGASNKAQGQQPSAAELSTKISIASPNSIPPKDSGYKVELDDLRGGFRQSDFSITDLKEAWNLYSQIPAERIPVFLDVAEEGKFKTWIEDLEATGLLMLESGSLRITAMLFLMIYVSVLQDKTPDKLEKIDNGVITLLYCCGSYDQIHGIGLLYESLVAQLLRTSYEFDTELFRRENIKKAFEGDVDHLALLLPDLLGQLPEKMPVLCMIEGIDYYEAQKEETIYHCICQLTHLSEYPTTMKAKFKILVTSKPGTQTVNRLTESGGLYEHNTISTEY